jgi:hypothetical protein
MYLYCSDYRKKYQVWQKKQHSDNETFEYPWPVEKEWSKSEIYALEKHYIGETFTYGKKDAYGEFFNDKCYPVKLMKELHDRERVSPVKVEIKNTFAFKVKKETSKYLGQEMIKAMVEDHNGDQMSLTIFPDRWKNAKDRLKQLNSKAKFDEGLAISFSGTINDYEDEKGLIMDELYDCRLSPTLPKDLKAKKLSIKKAKGESKAIDLGDTAKTIESIEDDLFFEGFIDLDKEEDNGDI